MPGTTADSSFMPSLDYFQVEGSDFLMKLTPFTNSKPFCRAVHVLSEESVMLVQPESEDLGHSVGDNKVISEKREPGPRGSAW